MATKEPGQISAWRDLLDVLATGDRRVLLLGAVDTGKTTFARQLLDCLSGRGSKAFYLDLDVGQSELGPPACAGIAELSGPFDGFANLTVRGRAFVGATSPAERPIEYVAAARKLADLASGSAIVADIGGFVEGALARRVIWSLVELLSPTDVVALQRSQELMPILAPLERTGSARVHRAAVPDVISRKSPVYRANRRALRWAAYFRAAAAHEYALETTALVGTCLGSGEPLPPHLVRYLNGELAPSASVLHAELAGRQLHLVLNRPVAPTSPLWASIQRDLRVSSISTSVDAVLRWLLVGLEAAPGRMLGLGVIQQVDYGRGVLTVQTPVRTPAAARLLRLGLARVTLAGEELKAARPTDV